ncbi:universal stress protein [Streptomyces sp. ADMS]|uniref:universal stress protein n=1 Tax=Streptomyces sp. ADMS TaxID=3071415 RepID=UPI00296FBEB3|nr:universal stress protein [Streptomyces sp. ADMS]MDW4909221.1 universal stress protein [Streptomyces sp. ADMS]
MSPQTLTETRTADTGTPVLPLSLPHPVTALVTNRPDDLAVVDAAARLAAPREAPVLLVAILLAPRQVPDRARVDAQAARVFLARVLPRLRRAGVGYIPVAHPVPADSGGQPRLRAAGGVLALAARHHSPLVVASSRGPAGLDAHSLIEASSPRGGPFVYAVAPIRWTVPVAGADVGPADLSPAGVRNVWRLAQRRLPAAARPVRDA